MSGEIPRNSPDGRGYPVVKHKPGNKGWGHEAAPVVRRQPPSSSAQRLAATRVSRPARCVQYTSIPEVPVHRPKVAFGIHVHHLELT